MVEDLKTLIAVMKPQVIYTHNLADKHDTHVAVTLRLIRALRELPGIRSPSICTAARCGADSTG